METTELEKRLTAALEKKTKIEKRITKWSQGLNSEAKSIAEERTKYPYGTDQYKQAYDAYTTYSSQHEHDNTVTNPEDWNKGPSMYEYFRAFSDLKDNSLIIQKYQNMLKIAEDKENTVKIPVLIDFLNNWKDQAYNYYIDLGQQRLKLLNEFQDKKDKYVEDTDFYSQDYKTMRKLAEDSWEHIMPEVPQKHLFKAIADSQDYVDYYLGYDELDRQVTKIRNLNDYDAWYSGYFEIVDVNKDLLNKTLEKEKENKYFQLVDQITKYVGEIKDVSNLKIGPKGDLNGLVIGDKGKASVQTIFAGGEHVNEIVNIKHGQVLRYRTLVKPLK